MELTFPSILITSILLFISLKLIQLKWNKSKDGSDSKLPPGPWKLPVIGSVHHLALAGSLPHRALRDLSRKYGQMMHLQLGEISAVVVSGPGMAKEVLKTHDIAFANRPKLVAAEVTTYNYRGVAFAPYGDYWRQMRKICVMELLSVKNVHGFASIREDETWKMISSIQAASSESSVNLTEKIFALTNAITSRAAFGIGPKKRQDELIRLSNRMTEMASGFDLADLFPSNKFIRVISGTSFKLKKLFKNLDQILDEIIKEHREKRMSALGNSKKPSAATTSKEEDIVDVLLKINEEGSLEVSISTESIKAIIVVKKSVANFYRWGFIWRRKPDMKPNNLLFISLKFIQNKLSKSRDESDPKLPPGPWKLPIIGSLHHLALAGSLPHRALRDLSRKYGQIMHLQLGEISAVVVSGPQMAKEVLKTHDIALASRPKIAAADIITYDYRDVGFAPYGDYWRQMRKICVLELLSVKNVRGFSPIREDETWKMIRSIQASSGSSVNLTDKLFVLTNAITSRATFGIGSKQRQDELIRLSNRIMEIASGLDVADLFPSKKLVKLISGISFKLKKLFSSMDQILDEIIQEHREKMDDDDIVDVLLKVNERGDLNFPISTDGVKAIIVDMFIAGTETSATTISWAMSEMIRNPRVMEKAQAEVRGVLQGKSRIRDKDLNELSYLKLVIKETLRLYPPIPLLLPRECREKCEIEGYDIPKGTRVIVNAWAINRDPEFWKDAESFEPERFMSNGIDRIGPNFEYIPFGAGRRMCPGISYAAATMELALAQLLYHFNWKIPDDSEPELDMSERLGVNLVRTNSLFRRSFGNLLLFYHFMELTFSPIFIFSILFFLSLKFISYKLCVSKSKDESGSKLPPGPWKLPIIGSLHHLALAGSLPHRALRDLSRKYGQIMHLQLGEISAVVVSGPQMAKHVLKTHDIALASRPRLAAVEIVSYNYRDVAFAPYGDYWRQVRKICVMELLSVKNVRRFSSIREDETWNMISSIQTSSRSSSVNLTEKVFTLANAITSRAAFGIGPKKRQEELIRLGNRMTEMASGFDVADLFPSKKSIQVISGKSFQLKKVFKNLDQILDEIIREHREKKISASGNSNNPSAAKTSREEDIVDVLLKIDEEGSLDFSVSTDSIKAIIVDMFAGGTETSATAITWAMSEMIRNPRVMEKAQAEVRAVLQGKTRIFDEDLKGLSYLKLVIQETLRLYPPVPLLVPRECREHCEIEGYEIPIGTKVIVNAWAINRDPEFWKDAETFKPERFVNKGIDVIGPYFEYIPFGAGRRICPGISFATPVMELALAQLLYHFDWKIPGGKQTESLNMMECLGAVLRRKNALCLAPTIRVPFE
ncbi:OLC1v1021753C2 [Oldenlandia corymbosa var. corymbosa]|uniref:OLC1v1021753C2 n=1 Tax=Oldenlandia corymbosa var. corymbosa TaxID=529605 RepID=A0AAV1BWC9_OLDCO|nr:OLC1v1021753C2 [Oldenlandia corymbosa var. corymbosa]